MNNRYETVNLCYLEEISGGDINFQRELIEIFLEQIPDFISNMKLYLVHNQTDKLAKEAHTAKSSVLIFNLHYTGKYLKQIQYLAEENQPGQIIHFLQLVEAILKKAIDDLKVHLLYLTEITNLNSKNHTGS